MNNSMWIALGIFGGMTALGAAAVTIWNSKQLRTARTMKRTGKMLHRVGAVLAGVCEE